MMVRKTTRNTRQLLPNPLGKLSDLIQENEALRREVERLSRTGGELMGRAGLIDQLQQERDQAHAQRDYLERSVKGLNAMAADYDRSTQDHLAAVRAHANPDNSLVAFVDLALQIVATSASDTYTNAKKALQVTGAIADPGALWGDLFFHIKQTAIAEIGSQLYAIGDELSRCIDEVARDALTDLTHFGYVKPERLPALVTWTQTIDLPYKPARSETAQNWLQLAHQYVTDGRGSMRKWCEAHNRPMESSKAEVDHSTLSRAVAFYDAIKRLADDGE